MDKTLNKAQIAKIDWLLANNYTDIHQIVANLIFQESKNILAQGEHDVATENNKNFVDELRTIEEFDDIPENLKNKILSEIEKPIENIKTEMSEFYIVTEEQGKELDDVIKRSITVAVANHPLIYLF